MERRDFLAVTAVAAALAGSGVAAAAPAGNDNDIVGSWFGTAPSTSWSRSWPAAS